MDGRAGLRRLSTIRPHRSLPRAVSARSQARPQRAPARASTRVAARPRKVTRGGGEPGRSHRGLVPRIGGEAAARRRPVVAGRTADADRAGRTLVARDARHRPCQGGTHCALRRGPVAGGGASTGAVAGACGDGGCALRLRLPTGAAAAATA